MNSMGQAWAALALRQEWYQRHTDPERFGLATQTGATAVLVVAEASASGGGGGRCQLQLRHEPAATAAHPAAADALHHGLPGPTAAAAGAVQEVCVGV